MEEKIAALTIALVAAPLLLFASVVFTFLGIRLLYKVLRVTRSITEEQKLMAQVFFPNVKIPEGKEGQPRAVGMGEVKLGFTWDDKAEGRG